MIGSLFSGIGGLELGLEWAGLGPVAWQVEIDPFCRQVLAKHWPDAVRFEDVTHVGKATLAPVDLICGGFPCQDISTAGSKAGLDGERSGLWFEYARIVDELKPPIVVVENVARLLTAGVDRVVDRLVGRGYRVWGRTIRALDIGAPHIRKRLFLVALGNADGVERFARQLGERDEAALAQPRDGGVARNEVADAMRARREGGVLDEPQGWRPGSGNDVVADTTHDANLAQRAKRQELPEPGRDGSLSHANGVDLRAEQGRSQSRRSGSSEPRDVGETWGGAPQRIMGRDPHGLPARLDRWPAGPAQTQHDWEPPRTIAKGEDPVRRPRLKALGNAVVPHVAYEVGLFVRHLLAGAA